MKKYIFGLLLVLGFFSIFGVNNAQAGCKVGGTTLGAGDSMYPGGGKCSRCTHTSSVFGDIIEQGVVKTSASGQKYCSTRYFPIANSLPVSMTEPIVSPVPPISLLQPNQYMFKTYPFPLSLFGPMPSLPVNDPITIGNKNPSDPSSDTPVDINPDINPDGTVPAKFNTGSTVSIIWPPTSIFDNITIWNKPLANTFKAFTASTFVYDGAVNSKWYPLNFFTVANPTSKISDLPTVPINISWAQVPGVAKYRFTMDSTNPFGLNINLPQPIDEEITNPRTYSFAGRPAVNYFWFATPLKADSTNLLGPEIVSSGGPFWVHTATQSDSYCGIVAGRLYFTDKKGLVDGNCNPYYGNLTTWTNINGSVSSVYDTSSAPPGYDGYYPAREYIRWARIPGAVRYEMQWAFKPIPDGTAFIDNTPFTIGTGTFTAHTLGVGGCTGCGLNASDDLDNVKIGFQYAFGNINPPQGGGASGESVFPDGSPAGVYWRVRGIDENGNVIRKNLIQEGVVAVPLPKVPYQSGYPVWSNVSGSTGYVVDVVEKIEDFAKLPLLSPSEVPPVQVASTTAKIDAQPITVAPKKTNIFTSIVSKVKQVLKLTPTPIPQPTDTTTPADNVFLLRRVVPDYTAYYGYGNGTVTVNKFKKLLKEARVSLIEQSVSSGFYDELDSIDPATDYRGQDEDALATFNNSDPFAYGDYVVALNTFYPLVASDLGMTVITPDITPNGTTPATQNLAQNEDPSLALNQIKLITRTPIIITNKSAGNAKLVIAQSTDKKTTTLTFTTQTGTSGEYAFNITKINYPGLAGSLSAPGVPGTIHPLTYDTFGPMPVLPVLLGKGYAEFTKLLPGTEYFYRVRCLKDPNPLLPNSGTSALTFCPSWSPVSSFTTPTGVSTSPINVGSLTKFQGGVIEELTSAVLSPVDRIEKVKLSLAPGNVVKIKVGNEIKSYTVGLDGNVNLSLPKGEQKIEVMKEGYKSLNLTVKAVQEVQAPSKRTIAQIMASRKPLPKPAAIIKSPVAPAPKGFFGRTVNSIKNLFVGKR